MVLSSRRRGDWFFCVEGRSRDLNLGPFRLPNTPVSEVSALKTQADALESGAKGFYVKDMRFI